MNLQMDSTNPVSDATFWKIAVETMIAIIAYQSECNSFLTSSIEISCSLFILHFLLLPVILPTIRRAGSFPPCSVLEKLLVSNVSFPAFNLPRRRSHIPRPQLPW
ncbi:MAG: hypothetical protein GW805_06170 [Ignavibacteria bacterium]|nr:hypothetical protein [Ignavibacteria bacterium]NCS80526.1 hypothetical protein [Ignavibacteria bacterium]